MKCNLQFHKKSARAIRSIIDRANRALAVPYTIEYYSQDKNAPKPLV